MKKGVTLTSILAVVATVVTLWNTLDPWPSIGWVTPRVYESEINSIKDEFTTGLKEFQVEWRCSEWAEDLEDLYARRQAGDDSQQLTDMIQALRKLMDEAKCYEYEDY